MQNVCQKREELHKLDENIQRKNFFVHILVSYSFVFAYLSVAAGEKRGGSCAIVCDFDKNSLCSLRFGKIPLCYNNGRLNLCRNYERMGNSEWKNRFVNTRL